MNLCMNLLNLGASLAEGYQARMLEFEDFERQFEVGSTVLYIDSSALLFEASS